MFGGLLCFVTQQWLAAALSLALVTGVPDAALLAAQAESIGVPLVVALAVPTVESGRNLNPLLRGAHGDLGRFQVRPAVWGGAFSGACTRLHTYHANIRCGLRILRWCFDRHADWSRAVVCYNGTGPAARAYGAQVERVAGRIAFRLASHPEVLQWQPPSNDSLLPSSSP